MHRNGDLWPGDDSPKLQAVHLPVKVTFILLLSSLAVLHCYWFTLFVRMVV